MCQGGNTSPSQYHCPETYRATGTRWPCDVRETSECDRSAHDQPPVPPSTCTTQTYGHPPSPPHSPINAVNKPHTHTEQGIFNRSILSPIPNHPNTTLINITITRYHWDLTMGSRTSPDREQTATRMGCTITPRYNCRSCNACSTAPRASNRFIPYRDTDFKKREGTQTIRSHTLEHTSTRIYIPSSEWMTAYSKLSGLGGEAPIFANALH